MMFNSVRVRAGLSLVALLLTAGCSAVPAGGQSKDEALAQVRSIAGIDKADVSSGGSFSGFTRQSYTIVAVTLSPGFEIAKTQDFAEFLARVAWSVNVEEPNTGLSFEIDGSPPSELEAAFRDAGWDVPTDPGAHLSDVSWKVAREKLGRWPGPVPKAPEGMIVPISQASQ